MKIELHMDARPPYVIAPVDDPVAVEAALPADRTIGDGWWSSSPDQKQIDGRWKLYLTTTIPLGRRQPLIVKDRR